MFVGYAFQYATSTGNILNLKMQHIPPQFHVVYDDWFTTMYADDTVSLDIWEPLFVHHCEQIPISPMDTVHNELADQ